MGMAIKKPSLIEESAMWRATHRKRGENMGFLLSAAGKTHRLAHQAAFDALDENGKSHDWMSKVTAPIRTMCGLSGFGLAEIEPSYANATCSACFGLDPLAKG